jgi:hypothetical protein
MEFNKIEVAVVESAINESGEKDIRDLNELQLSLIGGGIGDVVWG